MKAAISCSRPAFTLAPPQKNFRPKRPEALAADNGSTSTRLVELLSPPRQQPRRNPFGPSRDHDRPPALTVPFTRDHPLGTIPPRRAGGRAGFKSGANAHGLRHHAITRVLLQNGGNITESVAFAGNADPRVTMRYFDNIQNAAGQAAARLDDDYPDDNDAGLADG